MTTYATKNLGLSRDKVYPRGEKLRPDFLRGEKIPLIRKGTRVVSMGSCFATEIRKHLVRRGYATDASVPPWGLVYNSFCARQELQRFTYGFDPVERWWEVDGALHDPYRRGVVWTNEDERERELFEYVGAATALLRDADVFVLTLGLAEVWSSRADGAVFWQVPPAGVRDPDSKHDFWLSTVEDNRDELEIVSAYVETLAPAIPIIVTVSPVPLRATFTEENVVVANARSKATLVLAAAEFAQAHDDVFYFPSYEIATATSPNPYEKDNRHVTDETVEAIMRVFFATYAEDE